MANLIVSNWLADDIFGNTYLDEEELWFPN